VDTHGLIVGMQLRRPTSPSVWSKAIWWLLVGLVALSCAYFLYRGPYRAWQHTVDLNTFYSASQAWLNGSNPYDTLNLSNLFRQAGGVIDPAVSLNPPLTFVLMAPLAMLPWPVAEAAWTILNLLLVAVCLWMVMAVARVSIREPRGLLFLSFAIALAPFHTSISQGQLTIPVTALVVASLWGQIHNRPVLSGICIALAVALKPQMGLLFLLLLLFRLQWKALLCGMSALAVITAVAVGRLAIAGVDWLPTLQSNLTHFIQGGTGDPTAASAYLMVNLQVLLHLLLADQTQMTLNFVTYAGVAAAGAVLLLALRHRDDQEAHILLYAGCAVLTLLVVYNRIYSATLLILPLAWAFSPLRPPRSLAAATIVAAAIAVFLIPGAAALASLPLPPDLQSISDTLWWRHLLVHEVYALVIILVGLLLGARYRDAAPARLGSIEAGEVGVGNGFERA